MRVDIRVTQAHIDRAKGFLSDPYRKPSRICPVSVAVCEALGMDVMENLIRPEGRAIWTSRVHVGVAGREYGGLGITDFTHWFDAMRPYRPLPPRLPEFTLDVDEAQMEVVRGRP